MEAVPVGFARAVNISALRLSASIGYLPEQDKSALRATAISAARVLVNNPNVNINQMIDDMQWMAGYYAGIADALQLGLSAKNN